ncbi:MAG TPA: hypothetical protein VNK49_14340 [Anaerolineales bacterium]|nr:hypothetical protein [Anaerolineales bacterium]
MKKIVLVVLAFVMAGCSALPDALAFLSTPTPGPTDTPAPTVTLIPTREKTDTPDPFALSTNQITPAAQETATSSSQPATPTPTLRPTITLEPLNPQLFTPSPNLFLFYHVSANQLVWGGTCEGARSILFTVQVATAPRLRYVLLFYRLQDKYSGRGTEWGGGAIMKDNDQGTYFYRLELEQIEDYRNFLDAWLQYQFVASTAALKVLGRSVVDRTSVSVTHCKALNP